MRRSLRGLVAAGIVSLGSVGALGADSKTAFPPCTTVATEADRKAAQGAFAAGQGSFNEADYPTAITYWRDAYRRDCSAHALLLNLARAFELKGDRTEAVNALETYLQRKPDAPDADQIRRRIENLKAQIAPAPPAAASAAPPSALPSASAQPAVIPPSSPAMTSTTSSSETSPSRSAAPLIMAGAGGVLGVVGAIVLAGGIKKVNDVEKECPNHNDCPNGSLVEEGNAGRTQQMLGGAMLGVGVAAAGGGILWYLLSSPSGNGTAQDGAAFRHATARPMVGPGFAGVSLTGSF